MNQLLEWLQHLSLSEMQSKITATIAVIFVLWLIQRFATRSIMRLQNNLATRYTWRKTATYAIYLIGVVAITTIWANQFGNFATFLGLLSAGLAFAFKDPLANMAGWYYILLQKPFSVGDRVQVGEDIGDVVDVNMFQFSLIEIGHWVSAEQSTGRILHIPNSLVFTQALANYNQGLGYIWNEVTVTITFESDWKACKQLLEKILSEKAPKVSDKAQEELQHSSGEYLIYYHKVTPIVYTNVKSYGVEFILRYLCKPKKRRHFTSMIWETVLEEFNKEENKSKMVFAYPTQRAIMNMSNKPSPFSNKNS